jgi:hypothetical protein
MLTIEPDGEMRLGNTGGGSIESAVKTIEISASLMFYGVIGLMILIGVFGA